MADARTLSFSLLHNWWLEGRGNPGILPSVSRSAVLASKSPTRGFIMVDELQTIKNICFFKASINITIYIQTDMRKIKEGDTLSLLITCDFDDNNNVNTRLNVYDFKTLTWFYSLKNPHILCGTECSESKSSLSLYLQ